MIWLVLVMVNYVFIDRVLLFVGYCVLDVDYDDDGYVFDMWMKGLVIGVIWWF